MEVSVHVSTSEWAHLFIHKGNPFIKNIFSKFDYLFIFHFQKVLCTNKHFYKICAGLPFDNENELFVPRLIIFRIYPQLEKTKFLFQDRCRE